MSTSSTSFRSAAWINPVFRSLSRWVTWAVLLAPLLMVLMVTTGWPLLKTLYYSFTDKQFSTWGVNWVWFSNYAYLLQDEEWWLAVRNTLWFTGVSVSLETILGLAIAGLMHRTMRGQGWYRAMVLIPWAIPTIVSTKIWMWMLNDLYGVINKILLGVGILTQPVAWTADPDWVMASIIVVDVWKTTPFMAILILAGLQTIPKSCLEAARVDHVSSWRVFWYVVLPFIRPALLVAVLFRTLDALRAFDVIYILSSNNADTATLSVFIRKQLVNFMDVGVGSAASMIMFLIIGGLALLYIRLTRLRFDQTGET